MVIDPDDRDRRLLDERGIRFVQQALTPGNYREVLTPLLTAGGGRGFCVNLSVDTSSLDIMRLCRELGSLYIDTVVEPWPGFYFDRSAGAEQRTNNALRNTVREEKASNPGGTTAVSCCGANPGMVSWFVKQALVDIARDTGHAVAEPEAGRPRRLGAPDARPRRQGRPHRRARHPALAQPEADGRLRQHLVGRGLHLRGPAAGRAGLGHPREMASGERPARDHRPEGRRLPAPARRRHPRPHLVPDAGRPARLPRHPQRIDLDRRLLHRSRRRHGPYRPTCHYAYHPANDAVLSLHEMFGQAGRMQEKHHILDENEIVDGIDELGVLVYGHARNAYWYGSQLSIEETRDLAPYQNATGLQVTSAVLAGMAWAIANPEAGIVETDEMDYRHCLKVQRPYLGPVKGYYTDWTPLTDRPGLLPRGHRRIRPLAVPQRAGALSRSARAQRRKRTSSATTITAMTTPTISAMREPQLRLAVAALAPAGRTGVDRAALDRAELRRRLRDRRGGHAAPPRLSSTTRAISRSRRSSLSLSAMRGLLRHRSSADVRLRQRRQARL